MWRHRRRRGRRRVHASRSFFGRGLPAGGTDAAISDIVDSWTANGYSTENDARDQGYVGAVAPDGTAVSLQVGSDPARTLSISSRSPCGWPDGTPPA